MAPDVNSKLHSLNLSASFRMLWNAMPTIQSLNLPVPKNWQEFETIVRDAQIQRWKSPMLQKNGRPGQKQEGVDIWGVDEIGRQVAIQCKRYKSPLKLKDVTVEVAMAEKFSGHLSALYIATTADHDAKLQEQVRMLSDKRVANDKFAVALLFWDEIVGSLLLNSEVFSAHYPQFRLPKNHSVDTERLIAALELGYYGADLWSYVTLTFGEYGIMAQVDPDEFIAQLRILDRRTQQLMPDSDAAPIVASLAQVRDGCLRRKRSKSQWDPVEVHAKRVTSRIQSSASLLCIAESNVLELGIQLGRIYLHVDDVSIAVQKQVKAKVKAVLPSNMESAIRRKFASAREAKYGMYGYRWAAQIYSFVDHELRFGT